ncbi:MFS general substrate transporter [Aspergillus sergii]|uniref:MFS general substrate transporter n=1 Tax=Aspergillus sergii TaxID=1034303 RepID=A0A5N6X6I5_9EURO|nr:MFS general substrate transporter [Aspergillus sergii]
MQTIIASEVHCDDILSVVSEVVTTEAHQLKNVDVEATAGLSRGRKVMVIILILLCNLIQYTSMFSTVAGGYEFSKRLGVDTGPGKANWMAAAYGLTQSAFVLISGRLGAIYGHQKLLLLGGIIIIVFSICNAFCNTYDSFIAVRAITGIGGGILMPNAVAALTIMIPPGKARNFTLAAFAASPPIGASIGALIVGAIMEHTEWKWHFIVIACFAALAFGGLFLVLPYEEPVDKGGKVDIIGAVLGLGGLLLFSIAWNQAPSAGWQTPGVIVILVLSVILMTLFFLWESYFAVEPIMPLTVFKAPSFNALIFVVLFIYMSVGISLWYMVAWQQLVRGWTVLHVAVGWIPYGIGASVAVIVAAWLVTILEAQYILALGCLTSFAASVLLATMPEQQIYWAQIFPATVLGSLCPDFVYVAAQIIASNSVQRQEQGIAGSLIGTLNLYGNSIGLGFAGTIEVQVARNMNGEVAGFRAALWFGAALAVAALALDLGFVRLRHVDCDDQNLPPSLNVPVKETR